MDNDEEPPPDGVCGLQVLPLQVKTWPDDGAVLATACPCNLVTVVVPWLPITSPAREPVNDVADVAEVAVEAFPVTLPVKLAVMVPAPDQSRQRVGTRSVIG
jgi:hypothetical protein